MAEQRRASAQEVSASAQIVAHAINEQKGQIGEVSVSAVNLSHLADDLSRMVARFTVEAEPHQGRKEA